jgi:hypothetical protein
MLVFGRRRRDPLSVPKFVAGIRVRNPLHSAKVMSAVVAEGVIELFT